MRILYIQYTNPAGYPPLEHSSRILANAGWKVLFLGAGALGAGVLRFPPHPNIEVRQLRFCPAGWRQKLHFLGYCLWVLVWVVYWRPRWVYASDPLVCPVALLLSRLPRQRLVYHEHDSPNIDEESRSSRFQQFILRSRRKLGQRAQVCVLPNEERAALFQRQTGGCPETVWNCPRREEIAPPRGNSVGLVRVLYHGSITPERLPPSVIRALAQTPPGVCLQVIGYETVGSSGYIEKLKNIAHEEGVKDRVEFIPAMSRSELMRRCRECDVGLALVPKQTGDINFQGMVGASNKPFDYLACGLALLVSELPDWQALYVTPGYALACDPEDAESIAECLRRFAAQPEAMRAMGERGRQRILQTWNYETEFAEVWQRLSS